VPRAGPKKVQQYSREFKLTAVRLSQRPGMQVQAVAAALDIHPFMLSRWRKAVRDGRLRGRALRVATIPPAREIARLQRLEHAHALLQEEHALLKKPSGSVPSEGRCVRVHPQPTLRVQPNATLCALWGDPRGVLRVVPPPHVRPSATGPAIACPHSRHFCGARWDLRESARA